MLDTIGVDTLEDLLTPIPEPLRIRGELDVPHAMDEHHLLGHLFELSRQNRNCLSDLVCFLGAGIYDRYIPASVGAVISRGEFLTAYTPYQPELSQGYLQTIYEFQTMVAELYGMDVANASMYDGATATAEAAIMAYGVTGKREVVVSEALHPHYRQVLDTYCRSAGLSVRTLSALEGATFGVEEGPKLGDDTACIVVQSPNFFGVIEDLAAARAMADVSKALLVVVADPVSCALLRPPGHYGADIVVGEGQPLGIAMGFGGPALGLFTCKREYVRRIPGRIVGRTTDEQGRVGYVMTLRTREQDIRREKATSNICTNQALMALAATVHLSALGSTGMRKVAEASVRNAQYALAQLTRNGASLKFPQRKVFCEFVISLPRLAEEVRDRLLERGILAGLPLGGFWPNMSNDLLVAVTEIRTKAEIDRFATELAAVLK